MRIDDVKGSPRFMHVEGEINRPLKENVDAIRSTFKEAGFTPFFERNPGPALSPHLIKVGLFGVRAIKQRAWLNWLLLAVTVLTTTFAGAVLSGADVLANPLELWKGLPFAASLIFILGSHELGHYFTCRRYGVQATPPFFIPFLPPFGTMGAIIRMGLTPNRRALIRIGAAGPIVGFLAAIPVTVIGLMLSQVVPQTASEGMVQFGEPLVFKILGALVFGFIPGTHTVMIHPVALAGWLGFFITALNLLPLSQLDGGHISYGLFGKKRIFITIATYALMAGVAFWFRSWNWLFWGVITVIFGFRHPPSEDEITRLEPVDFIIGIAALLILILTVVPVPIKVLPAK